MATIVNENRKNIRKPMNVFVNIYPPTGDPIQITNENLIRCVVSLRSDLSRMNPTLPESEIEIEASFQNDISDLVASLPDGTEIQYSAGYANTPTTSLNNSYISGIRYFYTDEQITWQDGVLHVHGVDQVNKLDEELAPLYVGFGYGGNPSMSNTDSLFALKLLFFDVLAGGADFEAYPGNLPPPECKIKHLRTSFSAAAEGTFATDGSVNAIIERGTRREILAKLMNITHQEFDPGFIYGNDGVFMQYVDAGWPYCKIESPWASYTINEEDCGNVKEEHERSVSRYIFKVRDVLQTGEKAIQLQNSATVFKQKGIDMSYDEYEDRNFVMYIRSDDVEDVFYNMDFDTDMQKRSRPYKREWEFTSAFFYTYKYGMFLFDDDVDINAFNPGGYSYIDLKSTWGQGYSAKWADMIAGGEIDNDAISTSLDRVGYGFKVTDEKKLIIDTGEPGPVVEIEEPIFNGDIYTAKYGNNSASYDDPRESVHLLPDCGLKFLAKRSRTTGSFTWKGNPRMQPRDVFEFVRLEYDLVDQDEVVLMTENSEEIIVGGNTEECTVETITITHEGGGTVSEITYRHGIV